jgi:AcrR family transcriptional regulator
MPLQRGPGRPAGKNTGATRERILRVARKSFAERGFSKTTMRAVAAQAKVDAALVHYFFHTKEQLFAEAIDLPVPVADLSVLLEAQGPIGERLVRFFLEEVFGTRQQVISAILRTALSEPSSVPALRARIESNVVDAIAALLPGADARLRAELLGAQIVGVFIMRHVIRLEPIASASTETLIALLGAPIDALLGRSSDTVSTEPTPR